MESETLLLPQKIKYYLKSKAIPVYKAAQNVNVSKFHLGEVLKGKRPLCDSLRVKLNAYLDTDF